MNFAPCDDTQALFSLYLSRGNDISLEASLLLRFKKKNMINCERANKPERSFSLIWDFQFCSAVIYDSERSLGFV